MKGVTNETLGARLKRLREEVHMEQEIVATVLSIPRTAVISIEQGKREITAMELVTFCKLYRISPNDLLNWPKYRTRQSESDELAKIARGENV